jgi:hypothetical protein
MDLYNPPIGDTDVNMQVDAPRTKRGFDDMQTGDTSLAAAPAPKKLADESTVEALQAANIDSAAQVTVPASLSADSNLLQGLVFEDIPLPHSVLSRGIVLNLMCRASANCEMLTRKRTGRCPNPAGTEACLSFRAQVATREAISCSGI